MSIPAKPIKFSKARQVFACAGPIAIKRPPERFAAAKGGDAAAEAAEQEWQATISGYAMKWNTLSDDRGGYRVKLAPNSVKFLTPTFGLFHHDYAKPIGNTANGTLRLTIDSVGVKFEMDLPDTTAGRDTAELVEDQYVNGMSFGCFPDEWTESKEGDQVVITLSSFRCDEITVTAIPSFDDTSVGLVSETDPAGAAAGDYAKTPAADAVRLAKLKQAMLKL